MADSDFIIYYDDDWARIVTLLSIKSEDFSLTKDWDTELIILNIDKNQPYFKQILDIDAREIELDYEQSIMFLRDKNHKLFQLDMNNFQMKSDEHINYMRTELMRYYIHNSIKMSQKQINAIISHIPFNTHFRWDCNLVSVLAHMGDKSDAV